MTLTPDLLAMATGCSAALAQRHAPHIAEACRTFAILPDPARLAAFLGQTAHESGGLHYVREIADGAAYEGRRDLGNNQPGDGRRYRGRGWIQCTGRRNYAAMRDELRRVLGPEVPDFEVEPETMEQDRWAAMVSACWWWANGCNSLADDGRYIAIGRLINRGNADSERPANHEAQRVAAWHRATAAIERAAAAEPAGADAGVHLGPEPKAATPTPPAPPAEDAPMSTADTIRNVAGTALGLLNPIAGALFAAFAPLAQEKLERELARHTSRPEVAAQVSQAIIDTAKAATGKADAVDAVAAARADPAIVAQAQQSALDELDRLLPLLERAAAIDRQDRADDEASRQAAAQRHAATGRPQDAFLTRWAVWGLYGVLIGGAALAAWMAWLGKDVQMIVGALLPILGVISATYRTRYEYDYGSSHGSATKQMVVDEMARRR